MFMHRVVHLLCLNCEANCPNEKILKYYDQDFRGLLKLVTLDYKLISKLKLYK